MHPLQKMYRNVADEDVEKCIAFHKFLFDFDGNIWIAVDHYATLEELEATAVDAARKYDFGKLKSKTPTELSDMTEAASNAAKYGVAFAAFNIKFRSYAL